MQKSCSVSGYSETAFRYILVAAAAAAAAASAVILVSLWNSVKLKKKESTLSNQVCSQLQFDQQKRQQVTVQLYNL